MSISAAPNRKARRAKDVRRRTGIAAAAAVTTAAALTVGVSTPATTAPRVVNIDKMMLAADPINLDLITTGGVFGLVSALGYKSIPITIPPLGGGDPITLSINLNYTNNNPENLYNTINALPMTKTGSGPLGIFCSETENKKNGCRIAPVVTLGEGANGLRSVMDSLWSIALGTNLQNYAPLTAGDTITNAIVVNDKFRPNGGLAARFGAGLQNIGTAPADAGADATKVSNHLLDIAWEYNPQGDFPVTLNPFAMVNSLMGVLPPITNLLTTSPLLVLQDEIAVTTDVGGKTYAPGDTDAVNALASALEWFSGGADPTFQSLFATLVSGTLPMFELNALGTYATNSVLKRINSPFLFGDVISELFTPAMKILVNIAYPDVITPDALKANPALAEAGYKAYDRTFAQQQIAFGSVQPLTFGQQLQAYGDAWNAFTTSLTEQFKKPFFGIVVPNTIPGAAATKPAATSLVKAAPAAAAVAEAPAPVAAPVVSAPAEISTPAAVSAPASEPKAAPAIEIAPVVEAPAVKAPAATPAAQTHRGGAAAKSDAGSDTPGHRGSSHSASGADN